MLRLEEVSGGYGRSQVLHGVSLTVSHPGLVMLGPNGAGKTSLLRAVSGTLDWSSGSITLDGRELRGLKPARIARLGLGHVPQGRRLFGGLTVRENLQLAAFAEPRDVVAQRLERIFDAFPRLREFADRSGRDLSGGEQQMVAVGRGLMMEPSVILLDEPTMGLSPVAIAELTDWLQAAREGFNASLLLVEQHPALAAKVLSEAVVLVNGGIAWSGEVTELLQGDVLNDLYLAAGGRGESDGTETTSA